jgi:hypothetical protein
VGTVASGEATDAERSLTVRLERFTWDAVAEEATREGLAIEELVAFSVLYYLADLDSGRISRRISGRGQPLSAAPEWSPAPHRGS